MASTSSGSRIPGRVRVQGRPFDWTVPPGAVYVGRSIFGLPGSPFGNPHTVGPGKRRKGCRAGCGVFHTQAEAVAAFRQHLQANPHIVALARDELAGRDVACLVRTA